MLDKCIRQIKLKLSSHFMENPNAHVKYVTFIIKF